MPSPTRPLGGPAYGSIPHLPGSRTGPADRHLGLGQARWGLHEASPEREVFVEEKLDGSCVAATRIGDEVLALGRQGDLAARSRNEGRRLWAAWVTKHRARFVRLLAPGERVVGEWLALVHGTRYALSHEPFVAFDLFDADGKRLTHDLRQARLGAEGFALPALLHRGGPLSLTAADALLGAHGHHGALQQAEGAVWRVERHRGGSPSVEWIAKFVRPGKEDGRLLPERTGRAALWNWRPSPAPPTHAIAARGQHARPVHPSDRDL
tara:strand:+ start:671 stop:1468 length:798 start_codon:yes stop_codon:yes gene_type:complete